MHLHRRHGGEYRSSFRGMGMKGVFADDPGEFKKRWKNQGYSEKGTRWINKRAEVMLV